MENYPTSLDNGTSLPTPSATDDTNSPSLSGLNGSQNNAIIALETKLGITASTPTAGMLLRSTADGESTWDLPYPASETFVGLTDTQTLTNKTIDAANNTITNLTGADLASQSITATQIANATITNTQIASGGIDYANLLPTIFSGQFSSYINNGTGGGTFYYGNIGGLKVIAGQTDLSTSAPSLNYPSGFFTTWANATFSLAASTVVPTGAEIWANSANNTGGVSLNISGQPSGMSFAMSFLVVGV